jgi:hypothetical protein
MTTMPTTAADIMEALGHHDAAAALRWSEAFDRRGLDNTPRDELIWERDDLADRLEELEALLCKRCGAKWDGRDG